MEQLRVDNGKEPHLRIGWRKGIALVVVVIILCIIRDVELFQKDTSSQLFREKEMGVKWQNKSKTVDTIEAAHAHGGKQAPSRGENERLTWSEQYCINDSKRPDCCSTEHCGIVRNSTLYSSCCNSTLEGGSRLSHRYPLYIAAAPRSGTVFIATVMTKLGIRMANDGNKPVQDGGMSSWVHFFKDTYELEWVSAKNLHNSKFDTMWHQVRDPLKCLTSIAFTESLDSDSYARYISRHITLKSKLDINKTGNVTQDMFLAHRAMEFYLQWNDFLSSLKLPLLRLEDLIQDMNTTVINEVFQSMGKVAPHPDAIRRIISSRRRSLREHAYNHRSQKKGLSPVPSARRLVPVTRNRPATLAAPVRIQHNSRTHRDTLQWAELCMVNLELTKRLLRMSHSLGYYQKMTSVCE